MTDRLTARATYVPVHPSIWSSHLHSSGERAKLCEIVGGDSAPLDVVDGLGRLERAIRRRGGVLYITTLGRSYSDQQQAHEDNPGNAVRPGYSLHQARRAIDIDLARVGVTDEQLADAMTETGWTPISNEPWHWELLGPWAEIYAERGPGEAAMAACLDQGNAYGWYDANTASGRARTDIRALQAQCWRAGAPAGAIDGLDGPATQGAVAALKMDLAASYVDLHRLVSAI
jgi:hypothetical protein